MTRHRKIVETSDGPSLYEIKEHSISRKDTLTLKFQYNVFQFHFPDYGSYNLTRSVSNDSIHKTHND